LYIVVPTPPEGGKYKKHGGEIEMKEYKTVAGPRAFR
jgi:hypothetical protein